MCTRLSAGAALIVSNRREIKYKTTQVCGSDDACRDSRVSGLSLRTGWVLVLTVRQCYVMATREPNEHEEEEDTVNIVLHEPGAEQENERPLLSDVTPLEGLVFLMFLWRTTAHEA